MKKSIAIMLAIMACAVVAMAMLAACGNNGGSGGGASSAAPDAAATSAPAGGAGAGNAAGGASGALVSTDGVEVIGIAFEMVGETPNFQIELANSTDKDAEFDLSKFKVMLNDAEEVNFHLTSTNVKANTPRLQRAETASAGTLKVGDTVTVYYDGTPIGTYEVGEF